uniref:Uncharacterized protein n=1 Tax=Acrobeloides nanus TaxID=290746 RepID=A0A914DI37_9BILA
MAISATAVLEYQITTLGEIHVIGLLCDPINKDDFGRMPYIMSTDD